MSELIRTGIVSSVNNANKTVRVYFPELDDDVSHELGVIDTGGTLPIEQDEVLCLFLPGMPDKGYVLKILK